MTVFSALPSLRTSFSFRLFAIFTAMTALLTLALTGWYTYVTVNELRAGISDRLHLQARHLAEAVRLPLYAENRETLQYLAEEVARDREIYSIRIASIDGRVLADIRKDNDGTAPPDKLTAAVEVRSSTFFSTPDTLLEAGPEPGGTLIGYVRMERDTTDLKRAARNNILASFGLAFLFWLAVTSLSFFVLRSVTRSFSTLMAGIGQMQAGDLATRITVERMDEPGRAAVAVNELAESLQQREQENRKLQEELLQAMRIEVQNEKKLLMAQLIQTNRMTSIGLMASSMAHEINNPVGAISMANQFLCRAWEQALPLLDRIAAEEGNFSLGGVPFTSARTDVAECCGTIDRSTERIVQVITDLRGYSLGERNELHPGVDVNQVVADALSIVKAHGRHFDATITAKTSPHLPAITGSHHQLVQVVVNLLMNAVQALPDGRGTIVIGTGHDTGADQIVITVRDNGTGIPPEVREHLLEPFVSTRIDRGGSGLGLFVTNFIVTAHGGWLAFDSSAGYGTTVTVRLPRNPQPQT
jgi:signal transduction histidine kinase